MLTQKDFDLILKEASKLYSGFELELISEIAERIANVGYANTVVYNDVAIAQEMGMMYQDVVNLVAKYNNTASDEIERIFKEAGISSIKLDDKIYKEAGLTPRGLSSSMTQLLTATAKKTSNNLTNLCMTTAETSQTQFYNAINKAYLETSTGVKSYSTAIIDAIKDVSQQGAYVSYGTRKMSLEASTRMNILTGVNQTSGKLQLMRAEEMGWDLMEISAHSGARPEHAEWQGKIVSRSGKKGYLSLDDIGYGEVTGFQGVNCRHTWFPYYEGSTLTYTDKELEELKNEKVTYNGVKYTKYEASQIQRKMERQIRQDKKDIAGLQGILTSDTKDDKLIENVKIELVNTQMKIKQNNSILNDFVSQTGLKKDNTRLVVGNTTKSNKNSSIKNQKDIFQKLKGKKSTKITSNTKNELTTIKSLKIDKIEYNPVSKLNKKLSEKEIINRIGGGDMTKGSCSSVSLAYIGNKNGLNVLDFRGGKSQTFFSTPYNFLNMCDDLKINYDVESNYNDVLGAMNLLNKVKEGKEYLLSTGNHTTIIKKVSGKLQYLELQETNNNGFKPFTIQTLKKRFGCKQSNTVQGNKVKVKNILIDTEEFKNKNEFKEILGYINTYKNKQMKGVSGSAK